MSYELKVEAEERYRMLPLGKCCQFQFSVPNDGGVIKKNVSAREISAETLS